MSLHMKVAVLAAVLLNLTVMGAGWVTWMDSYNAGRLFFATALIVAPLLNLYLIAHEFRSTERRLEKRLRIARMEKELAQLGR